VQTVQVCARQHRVSLLDGARIAVESRLIGGKGGQELRVFVEAMDRWHRLVVTSPTRMWSSRR
jgi:DNA helicase-2/ATP-dependent DNA helicase PcrA